MCGPRTGNYSGTRIRIRPYFVEWKAQHLCEWMERFFGLRKGDSTALKHCLTKDLILFSNLREILPIQGNLSYTEHLLRAKFCKRLEPSQFVGNSPINDGLKITIVT